MRRMWFDVVILVVAVAAFTAWSAHGAATRTGLINVTATLTKGTARQVDPPGRRSNASEQAWRITDRHGVRLGRLLLQCRWITDRSRLCYGEMAMPLGKITVAGASPTQFDGEYAVTGGTGAYQGGGGTMLFTSIGFRKNVLLVTITT